MNPRWSTITPFSSGETTNHPSDGYLVIVFPDIRDAGDVPMLHSDVGLGTSERLKRDSPQSIATWPLRHSSFPEFIRRRYCPGCIPLYLRVRVATSVQGRTRTGKIWLISSLTV